MPTVPKTAGSGRKLRVVVCGATFGQIYLKGICGAARFRFELAGILAGGSERSHAQAQRYGTSLYTSVSQLPSDVDIACVVVRSGILGGSGSVLAQQLLSRGVHVLQEQPVHGDELAQCLREAKRNGVVYHLNPFYRHLEPVRRFTAAARALLRRRKACFVDVVCGIQVSYPMVDILGQALGKLHPWVFSDPMTVPAELSAHGAGDVPFRSMHGVVAGIPLTLRVQNQLHTQDPDNHAHLLHRVAIGTDGGILTLADTHGPVLWSPRLHVPREPAGDLVLDGTAAPGAKLTSTASIGPSDPIEYRKLLDEIWPAGVVTALDGLVTAIDERADPLRHGQYYLTTCQVWQDFTRRLGPAKPIDPPQPRPMSVAELLAAIADDAAPTGGRHATEAAR